MYARRRGSGRWVKPKLGFTAMIDVVFLLLVFFVLVVRAGDVLSRLDVTQSGGCSPAPVAHIRIDIDVESYTVRERPLDYASLSNALVQIGRYSPSQPVLVSCAPEAPHSRLVKALDLCSMAGLEDVSFLKQ